MKLSKLLMGKRDNEECKFRSMRARMLYHHPDENVVGWLMTALNRVMGPGGVSDPVKALERIVPGINSMFDSFLEFYPMETRKIDALIARDMPGTSRLEAALGSGYDVSHILEAFIYENYEKLAPGIEKALEQQGAGLRLTR